MKILLLSLEPVRRQMAGPAIRYWELAHALAARHEVTLLAPVVERASDTVTLREGSVNAHLESVRDADVVLAQQLHPRLVITARRAGTALVLDAYDPIVLENLQAGSLNPRARHARLVATGALTNFGLLAADSVICASETQRDLWLGSLLALGRVDEVENSRDASMRALVDVVPFGLPPGRPKRRAELGPRRLFGLADDDLLVLWGGGIWDWLDPVTVIEGVALARVTNPKVQLVFMGTRHPVATVDAASGAFAAAVATAERLQLLGNGVYFKEGWVDYDERQSFLAEADVGVSAHLQHVETRFSFRTRVLDYLWAGLPCVLTEGDSMAELAAGEGFGIAVAERDAPAWAAALLRIAADTELRGELGRRAEQLSERFLWSEIALTLERSLLAATTRPRSRRRLPGLVRQQAALLAGAAARAAHEGRLRQVLCRLAGLG